MERALAARIPEPTVVPGRLHEAMRYSVLGGGKRIRPALVFSAAHAVGLTEDEVEAAACAIELIHVYSLVHDDLPAMDDDDLRRGRPTCHKAYDEAIAVLVGDALQTLAFHVLTRDPALPASPAVRLKLVELLAEASGTLGMAGGQAIDLAVWGQKLNMAQVEDLHARKTGALIRATTNADSERDKPTHPAIIGIEASQERVRLLHDQALASLAPFGARGELLRSLADWLLARRY
jgi:farnesyl diphosphate synthase